jgi:hypothetical protein
MLQCLNHRGSYIIILGVTVCFVKCNRNPWEFYIPKPTNSCILEEIYTTSTCLSDVFEHVKFVSDRVDFIKKVQKCKLQTRIFWVK